jgi:Zn-dependent protease/CBS domain-containing protein
MRGFRLGKLFGVEIRVNPSWLFIFLLLTWNLTIVFTRWHPSWSPGLGFAIAIAASLLFFASILAHELAHTLVARAYDIPVTAITLFLFGGVSNIEREPPSPKAEFLMAVVGPLVSIVLGVVFVVIASFFAPESAVGEPLDPLAAAATMGPLTTLLAWLGPINILVGIFNLIPGFPLDGGRILRAIIWAFNKNLLRATRAASRVGQAIGWGFVVIGIASAFGARVPFFGGGIIGGLWLAFIGWFLASAAEQSYERLVVQDVLHGANVARLMRREGAAITADTPLDAAVTQWFMRSDERAFPVVQGADLLGIIARSDVRKVPDMQWPSTLVRDVMTPRAKLVTTTQDEPLDVALSKLTQADVGSLPVLDGPRLVGILERRDVARWIELRLGHPPGGAVQPPRERTA